MLLQNKSNLINTIKTRNSNVICSSQLADMIPENMLSAVIVDDNSSCRKDVVKLQKGINNSLNAEGMIINASEYSKQQIMQIHEQSKTQGVDVLYKIASVNDIAKIRSVKAEVLILGSDDISTNNVNPYILKMLIDWEAVCLLNCSGDGISMQHILEYGLADCIEDNTNMQRYTANTYKRYSLINTKNTFVEPLMIESIDIIKNNIEIHNPLWLSLQEGRDMMSIIKEYKVELIEFDIKTYNTIDKITEMIKKIKYKQ